MSLLSLRHTARGLRFFRIFVFLPALVLLASLQCVSPFGDSGTASQTNVVALSQSLVTISDTMIASGAEATATLRLKDTAGANVKITDATVQFAISGGGSTARVGDVTSKGDGQYTAKVTGLVAGSPSGVTATVNGGRVTSATPMLRVVAGPPSPAESQLSVQMEQVPSGSTIWLQLEVHDAAKNVVRDGALSVAFSTAGGTSDGTIGTATAQGDGVWRANFTAAHAGTPISVGATINGQAVTSAHPTVTVTPGTISSNSVITVSAPSVASGDAVTVSLQAKDPSGNNITTGGLAVVFTQGGGTSTGSFSTAVDHGNGTYTASFTGVTAGTPINVGATIGGAAVTTMLPSVTVHPGPANVGHSVLELSATDVAVGETVSLRLRTRDAAGNSLHSGGLSVQFNVNGSATGSIASTKDEGDGSYSAVYSTTGAGTSTVGATINGNPVTSAPATLHVRGGNQPPDTFPSHEPAGWTGDTWDMSSDSHPGWRHLSTSGAFDIASDRSSRGSPPRVGRWSYPAGFSDVYTFNSQYHDGTHQSQEFYIAYWWKPGNGAVEATAGDGFQMTTGITSYQEGSGPVRMVAWIMNSVCPCNNSGLTNSWSKAVPGGFQQVYLGGNVNGGNYVLTPGQWYRVEFYFKMSTGDIHSDNPDGTIRWWVNGTLVGDYNNVRTGASGSGLEAVAVHARPWRDGVDKSPLASADEEEIDDIRLLLPTPRPGTVSGFQYNRIWSNAVLLQFTETDDGYGGGPNYEVRFAPSPMSWGSASDAPGNYAIAGGMHSCRAPIQGRGRGFTETCYVVGLSPGIDYEFQIVAYRGTLDHDAVFGDLSDKVRVRTEATATDIAAVTDLGVRGGDDPRTQMDLSFTPPAGASDQPLRYDIRYGTSPFDWGSATSARQGNCADFSASGPDAIPPQVVHCSVEGLTPGTHYYFQLMPYRGTLDRDAVFGPMSNVVEATTTP